jgi:Acyl-CoA reductase (LuxC)
MNLQHRIELLVRLGEYILSDDEKWLQAKQKAGIENSWFIPEFIDLSAAAIAVSFLQKDKLEKWIQDYRLNDFNPQPQTIGIVMAGNIPLVGFHDLLCVFISGHKAMIKPSSRDQVLIQHLAARLGEWDPEVNNAISFAAMLKGCDAYIATGSHNSSRYFDYYFAKYPHIIRRNRTSVAILTGDESNSELENLAGDVYSYFGLGCRNVTKLYVPAWYDFLHLLTAFKKYNHLADHHKYKNNYDYNLAIHLLNKVMYMTNGSLLLVEETSLFSPISQLHYEYYTDENKLAASLQSHPDLQCIAGKKFIPFGKTQTPALADYADRVDTLQFLTGLEAKKE